jgi:hypothetical protein
MTFFGVSKSFDLFIDLRRNKLNMIGVDVVETANRAGRVIAE